MKGTMKLLMVVLGLALLAGAVSAAGGALVVKLVAKDPSTWTPVTGGFGSFMYQADKFNFEGHGLAIKTPYTLINYIDPWGATPQFNILGSGTTDKNGNIQIKGGAVTLTPYIYTEGEYAGQTGAKIWLVPTKDISGTFLNWDPTNFLFETSLIV
jgi:hypothetical protein